MSLWGLEWLLDSYKLIMEDKQSEYNFQFMLAPLARTPGTKEGARTMQRYSENIKRVLEGLTPWRKSNLREKLRKKGKSGQVVVMLDAGESANHPLYKDAKIIH